MGMAVELNFVALVGAKGLKFLGNIGTNKITTEFTSVTNIVTENATV